MVNPVLGGADFRGRWSAPLKSTGGIVWQWVGTFKEPVPPPGDPVGKFHLDRLIDSIIKE